MTVVGCWQSGRLTRKVGRKIPLAAAGLTHPVFDSGRVNFLIFDTSYDNFRLIPQMRIELLQVFSANI